MNRKLILQSWLLILAVALVGCDDWALWQACPDERVKGAADHWHGCICKDYQLNDFKHRCYTPPSEPPPEVGEIPLVQPVWTQLAYEVQTDKIELGTITNCDPFEVPFVFGNSTSGYFAEFTSDDPNQQQGPLLVLGRVEGGDYSVKKTTNADPWERTPRYGFWYSHPTFTPGNRPAQHVDPPEFASGPDDASYDAEYAYDVRMTGVMTTEGTFPITSVKFKYRATCE